MSKMYIKQRRIMLSDLSRYKHCCFCRTSKIQFLPKKMLNIQAVFLAKGWNTQIPSIAKNISKWVPLNQDTDT